MIVGATDVCCRESVEKGMLLATRVVEIAVVDTREKDTGEATNDEEIIC